MNWQDKYLNKIVCGDSLKLISKLPDESIDLVFADPPFNVGKKYGDIKDKRDDYYEWCEQWIEQCFKKLKATGTFYLMTIVRHLDKLFPMLGTRGIFINQVMWRNVSANHSKRGFWNSYQPILVYGKTNDYIFNTYAQTRQILKKNLRWGGYSSRPRGQLLDYWDDIPFIYAGSIFHKEAIIVPGTNRKEHPTQMPVALVKRAMLFSANKSAIILDPFSGVGTTAVACIETDRQYIGIEINPKYCEIARERIKEIKKQGNLFK